jgi:hypothetical protein
MTTTVSTDTAGGTAPSHHVHMTRATLFVSNGARIEGVRTMLAAAPGIDTRIE